MLAGSKGISFDVTVADSLYSLEFKKKQETRSRDWEGGQLGLCRIADPDPVFLGHPAGSGSSKKTDPESRYKVLKKAL